MRVKVVLMVFTPPVLSPKLSTFARNLILRAPKYDDYS